MDTGQTKDCDLSHCVFSIWWQAIGCPKTTISVTTGSGTSLRQSGLFPLNPLEQQQDVEVLFPIQYDSVAAQYISKFTMKTLSQYRT